MRLYSDLFSISSDNGYYWATNFMTAADRSRRPVHQESNVKRAGFLAAGLTVALLVPMFALAWQGPAAQAPDGWESLFDGQSLKGWKVPVFGGDGKVQVKNGQIILGTGVTLTGITSTRTDLPTINYEISLEAMKLSGSDFFCGLTFPVGNSNCSLIVGGWGGGVVGLSSLDGMDASENETSQYMDFAKNRWYRIRVRVTSGRIQAWIDDKSLVDAETKGRRVSIRPEVDLSVPLGVAAWITESALKDIKIRRIKP
jgi:hypothetical protein